MPPKTVTAASYAANIYDRSGNDQKYGAWQTIPEGSVNPHVTNFGKVVDGIRKVNDTKKETMNETGIRLSGSLTEVEKLRNAENKKKMSEIKEKRAAEAQNAQDVKDVGDKIARDNRIAFLQRRAANLQIKPTDWEKIRKALPLEDTEEDETRRNELFDSCDPNGNGFLSLAEVDLGLKGAMNVEELFKSKNAIIRAFNAAKGTGGGKSTSDDNYVSKDEFKTLLRYLRQYFEYAKAFERIDAGNDQRIDIEEFVAAMPMIGESLSLFYAFAPFRLRVRIYWLL